MDPTQKRILIDLSKDYRDKIRRAGAHLESMCDLADIDHPDMLCAIWAANLRIIVELIDRFTDMSAEDFAASCAEALRERRASNRRARHADN